MECLLIHNTHDVIFCDVNNCFLPSKLIACSSDELHLAKLMRDLILTHMIICFVREKYCQDIALVLNIR